jgi:2,4-dienoyl-CoA reductase-like NADH-dependent reductase (Old Yellow Enzyme family)/thioredoxin reductase
MGFKHIFEPYTLRGMELRNRIIGAPCERNFANVDGSVTQRYIDFLAERARGEVGLLMVESMYTNPAGRGHIRQLGVHDDSLIPGLKRLTDAVHQHGSKVATHLMHAGRETSSYITGRQPVAPSNVPCRTLAGGDIPRELTPEEIEPLITEFAEAARRSVEAGFDLIEIHGAHGYLINQFLSPFTNKRTDEYGGSFEKRMRFPLEIVAAVRKVVGEDFPLAYRMSADEKIDGGLTIDDMAVFSQELEKAGIDLLDVSAGIYESVIWIAQPMAFDRGCLVDLGCRIKEKVKTPVSVVGRINHPQVAEDILAAGKADFIALGRALHADAHWVRKAREGHVEDIRICPACMSCSDQLATNLPISCSINPEMGREREFALKPANVSKIVLVVGAGPAGMEAARVADLRGHHVVLCEKQNRMGGQLHYAMQSPHKQEYGEVIRFMETQLKKSSVEIRLGVQVTRELIEKIKPDVVVIATGAVPATPFIPGIAKPHVHTAIDVLDGRTVPRGKTAVIGAGLVGLETALFLVENGVSPVVIIEPTDKVGGSVGLRSGWVVRTDVANCCDIEVRTQTTVEEIKDRSIVLQKQGQFEELEVQNVVLAAGMRNENSLAEELKAEGKIEELYLVGDCNVPRTVKEAIEEAAIVARRI